MKQNQLIKLMLISGTCSLLLMILFLGACNSNEPELTPPLIITEEPSNITLTSATIGGSITSAQPELIEVRGMCWGRSPSPELFKVTSNTQNGSGAGSFKAELTNLGLYKYYVRAYAKMNNMVFYGNEVILDINTLIPSITTVKKESNSDNLIEIETTVDYANSASIIEKGICWGTISDPTVSANKIVNTNTNLTFNNTIPVSPWKAFYIRGYVITEFGVYYGNNLQIILIPPVSYGEVIDVDGNKYKTTTIGTKVWMAENLKVTRYNDGTSIESGNEPQFKTATNGMYTLYEGNSDNLNKFGYLYNGYVVKINKNVCMTGWHVPYPADWVEAANNLGGMETAGGPMKAISNLWLTPNTAADNASGFSAVPGGSYCRGCSGNGGIFADKGTDAYYWSSSVSDFYYFTNDLASMRTKGTANINDGLSIRCVKD